MKKFGVILLVMMVALFSVACSSSTSSEGEKTKSTLEQAKEQGFIKVGFANERPYAYATSSGDLTGLNVEIARAVFKKLGIEEMDGTLSQFGSLIPGLQAGRFDVITAGMYITPDRCEEVSFAEPEYSIGAGLAVSSGNPLDLHSYDDIVANTDVKVGIMTGAIENDYLKDMGIDPAQIMNVPDIGAAIEALKAGRVHTVTMTGPTLTEALDIHGDDSIERVTDFEQPVINGESIKGLGSAAFRQADQDFVEAYNEGLAELKESGELLKIYEQFGFTEAELPGDTTTKQLCSK